MSNSDPVTCTYTVYNIRWVFGFPPLIAKNRKNDVNYCLQTYTRTRAQFQSWKYKILRSVKLAISICNQLLVTGYLNRETLATTS